MTDPNGQAPEGQTPAPAAGPAPTATPPPAEPAAPAHDDGDAEGDPRITRANRQAAEARVKAREAAERAAAAEAELTKLKQASMSAEERQRAEFEAATKRAQELEGATRDYESRVQSMAVENAVLRAVNNLRTAKKDPIQFVDADDVMALLDRSAIQFGENGQAQNVDELLRDLAKRKPHLTVQPTTPGYSASTANPARSGQAPGAPTTIEDFRGKSAAYINQHWPAYLKAQQAAKGAS